MPLCSIEITILLPLILGTTGGATVVPMKEERARDAGIHNYTIEQKLHLEVFDPYFEKINNLISFCNIGTTTICADITGFKDKNGYTCAQYKEIEACKDLTPAEEQKLKDMENDLGMSALDACCVCGGGYEGM